MKKKDKDKDIEILSTRVFRLKDHPKEKSIKYINLKSEFGTVPGVIAVEKISGQNNRIRVLGFIEQVVK